MTAVTPETNSRKIHALSQSPSLGVIMLVDRLTHAASPCEGALSEQMAAITEFGKNKLGLYTETNKVYV